MLAKEGVESLLSKATQLLDQIQGRGIRQSLAGKGENLKGCYKQVVMQTWMEVNSQVKECLDSYRALFNKQKRENAEQDPQDTCTLSKLYDILMSTSCLFRKQ